MRDDEEEDEEEELGEEEVEAFARLPGREGPSGEQPPIPGGQRPGYQYQPPSTGGELIGWRVKATFPTGPRRELRWHDGYIFEHRAREVGTPPRRVPMYRIFWPVDASDEWVQPPFNDKSLCFRKAHLPLPDLKAGADELRAARAALAEREVE